VSVIVNRGVTMFVARRGTANLKMLESSERRSRETPSESDEDDDEEEEEEEEGSSSSAAKRRGVPRVRVARRRDAREGDATPSGFRENPGRRRPIEGSRANATDAGRRVARGDETRRGGAKTRVAQGASAAGEGPIVSEGDALRGVPGELSELT
jgi:hypothetical protein